MSILAPFEKALKAYCDRNALNYDKAVSFPRCGNESVLFIQRVDRSKARKGLNDNEPAEILLTALVDDDGKITFTKGENADKYLRG